MGIRGLLGHVGEAVVASRPTLNRWVSVEYSSSPAYMSGSIPYSHGLVSLSSPQARARAWQLAALPRPTVPSGRHRRCSPELRRAPENGRDVERWVPRDGYPSYTSIPGLRWSGSGHGGRCRTSGRSRTSSGRTGYDQVGKGVNTHCVNSVSTLILKPW